MRKTTAENNARARKKMDAKCNMLGYLTSSDEMSRFTPNLYDDIFIFKSKNKVDAISERAKYKRNDFFENEDTAPEIVEAVAEEVPAVVEPVVTEEVVTEEPIAEPIDEVLPVIAEQVEEPVAEEIVVELEPLPFVVLEPIAVEQTLITEAESIVEAESVVEIEEVEEETVVELEPLPLVILEPILVEEIEEVEEVEETVVPELAESIAEVIEESVEEEPVVEEVVEEEIYVEPEHVEEVSETAPFMAVLIDPSTEEDAELLKERYKTVPLEKRFERGNESVRQYYTALKNELLSYERVKSRMSKKFDTFSIARFTVAKITVKNDVVKLYLALANDSIDTKYYTEDVSSSEIYDQTPTLHNVKSKRGLKYGIELINEIMTSIGYQKVEGYEPIDFGAEFAPVPVSVKKQYIADLMKPVISVDECNLITNELAYDMLTIVKSDKYTINKFYPVVKYRMYTDDLTHWFEDGETVTIEALQEKGVLPKVDNLFLEVHGRGILDRKLFVEAHSYDMKAIKMILLTDGEAIQYK